MGYKPQVGKRRWGDDLDDLADANKLIIKRLDELRDLGMSGQAARYVADIAIAVARQQAAIGDLRDIASYSNGDEP